MGLDSFTIKWHFYVYEYELKHKNDKLIQI